MTDEEFADEEHRIYAEFRDGRVSRQERDANLVALRSQFNADIARQREDETREEKNLSS